MIRDVLFKIRREVDEGRVTEDQYGDYSLFKYSRQCAYGGEWNDVNRRCRGIVIDTLRETVVARPFDKFFNLGETPETSDHSLVEKSEKLGAAATAKMDGTMVAVWWDEYSLRCTTPGAFKSEQAVFACDQLLPKYDLSSFPRDCTLVCEMIAPWDRKVIDYGQESRLVALAAFENSWDQVEIPRDMLGIILRGTGLDLVPYYDVKDLLYTNIPEGEEGYVIRFDDGFRVKVKGDWYFKIHKLLDRISPKNVLEMLVDGSFVKTRSDLPVYLRGTLDALHQEISGIKSRVEEEVSRWWERVPKSGTQKDKALVIAGAPEEIRAILFCRTKNQDESKPFWRAVESRLVSLDPGQA